MRWLCLALAMCITACSTELRWDPVETNRQLRENAATVALPPGGSQSIAFKLRPNPAGPDRIFVSLPEKAAALSLHLPDGRRVDSQSAKAARLHWEEHSAGWVAGACDNSSDWTVIEIPPGAAAGEYSIEGSLPETSPAARMCATASTMGALPASALKSEAARYSNWVDTDQKSYQMGDTVKISTPVLKDGKPVTAIHVVATLFITLKSGVQKEIFKMPLSLDAKTGNYAGTYDPLNPGEYVVQVTVPGREQEQRTNFSVDPASGKLISASLTTARGPLMLTMTFNIVSEGEYLIMTILRSADGQDLTYQLSKTLEKGEQEVATAINRQWISGAKGPFELREIYVTKKDPNDPSKTIVAGHWMKVGGEWVKE